MYLSTRLGIYQKYLQKSDMYGRFEADLNFVHCGQNVKRMWAYMKMLNIWKLSFVRAISFMRHLYNSEYTTLRNEMCSVSFEVDLVIMAEQ